jgi:crotonobetainyl-CoA:carnitine CoA-transferase CaiB-like acyl-CoA transferase
VYQLKAVVNAAFHGVRGVQATAIAGSGRFGSSAPSDVWLGTHRFHATHEPLHRFGRHALRASHEEGIEDSEFDAQWNAARWPALGKRMADVFLTRSRDEWCELLEGTDACVAPVLDWDEAPQHAHNVARQTFLTIDGVLQPAPAPRFSRTPPAVPVAGGGEAKAESVLRNWGVADAMISRLIGARTV